jgi:hypothetical protein
MRIFFILSKIGSKYFLLKNYRNLFFGVTQSYDFPVNNTVLSQKFTPEVIKFTKTDINELDVKSNKTEEQIKNSNICPIKEQKNILEDPIIRNSEKAFEDLRERIMNSHFEHKTIAYKRLDSQLFKLMVKLDDIDIEDKPNLKEQRKQLLTKIHDSVAILENKVNCEIVDCIICRTGIDLNG